MAMFIIGALVGAVCGAVAYKFNGAAGAVLGFAATVIGVIGYDQIPTLVDNTWGAGSCSATERFTNPSGHAECVIESTERVIAGFWFLVGATFAAIGAYGILEHQHGERPL